MRQTWRWFGPHDTVSVDDMKQADVEGVVTALHHIPNGEIWPVEEIGQRKKEISFLSHQTPQGSRSGLNWEVVESLPVSEEIKQQSGNWREHIENYKTSLHNLAGAGIEVICYNFMPVLDWTRTDLSYTLSNGATCMRFDLADFAAFDLHILKRKHAERDFPADIVEEAAKRYDAMEESQKQQLAANIVCGLPGAEQGYSLGQLKEMLAVYAGITDDALRSHQIAFLEEIVPVAEELGMRLCCHPDDPPFSLLGLPRIMSCEEDFRNLTEAVESPANGITLCSGSLGVRADVDLPGMMERLGDKVHFIHLRNVALETEGDKISFHEASHLDGATDMVALIGAVLAEEQRRRNNGRGDHSIPFRPDHGHDILSDLNASTQPGYPAVGRLKGLAELRGIMVALSHPMTTVSHPHPG